MALSPVALVSLPEAYAALGATVGSVDPTVEQLINEVTALAESVYCHRPLARRAITSLRVAGPLTSRELYPDAWPINTAAAISVTVNGQVQTVWRSEADGDPAAFDVAAFPTHFYRAAGWAPTTIPHNVLLTYEGGYAPVPEDLKAAALELIQRMWGPLTQQRPEVAAYSGPGGSVQTLDAIRPAEAYALSRRSRDVFVAYRHVRVA
jgi:hypothetical protein